MTVRWILLPVYYRERFRIKERDIPELDINLYVKEWNEDRLSTLSPSDYSVVNCFTVRNEWR